MGAGLLGEVAAAVAAGAAAAGQSTVQLALPLLPAVGGGGAAAAAAAIGVLLLQLAVPAAGRDTVAVAAAAVAAAAAEEQEQEQEGGVGGGAGGAAAEASGAWLCSALAALAALAAHTGEALARVLLRLRLRPSVVVALELVRREWVNDDGAGRRPIVDGVFRFAGDGGGGGDGRGGGSFRRQVVAADTLELGAAAPSASSSGGGSAGAVDVAPPAPRRPAALCARAHALPHGGERHTVPAGSGSTTTAASVAAAAAGSAAAVGELLLLPAHSSVRCVNGTLGGITPGHRQQLDAALAALRAAAEELGCWPSAGAGPGEGTEAGGSSGDPCWPCAQAALAAERAGGAHRRLRLLPLRLRLVAAREELSRLAGGGAGSVGDALARLGRAAAAAGAGAGGAGKLRKQQGGCATSARVWKAALQLTGVAAGTAPAGALQAVLAFDVTELAPAEASTRWQVVVALTRGLTRATVSSNCATATIAVVLPLHDWLVCCFDISQELVKKKGPATSERGSSRLA